MHGIPVKVSEQPKKHGGVRSSSQEDGQQQQQVNQASNIHPRFYQSLHHCNQALALLLRQSARFLFSF